MTIGPSGLLPANLPQPELLRPDGIIELLPAAAYDAISADSLRLWCHFNARYGLPTVELVEWLRDFISDRSALEIGSGAGDLAHHAALQATDNRMQEWPKVRQHYSFMKQPTVRYPEWVEGIDALDAVRKYRPEVVVGCWVTEWIDPALPLPAHGGNMHGVKEGLILDEGVTYVLIGNESIHGYKKILERPHRVLSFPWLRSRSQSRDKNRIWIWEPQ